MVIFLFLIKYQALFFPCQHLETRDGFSSYFVASTKSDFVVNLKSVKAFIKKRTKRDWNTLAELFEFSG